MEGYTKKTTPSGYTRYYKDNKAVSKKLVPERVITLLANTNPKTPNVVFDAPAVIGSKNKKDILYSSPIYKSYEFTYNRYGEKDFYYKDKKVTKIPNDVLEVLNQVDDELDFLDLIDQRVGSKKRASVWLDIVKEGDDFNLYYVYKDWEIPGDRVPRRILSEVRYVDQDMADSYLECREKEKESRVDAILASRREQLEHARETLDLRLAAEKEEAELKKKEQLLSKREQKLQEQERLRQQWQGVVENAEKRYPVPRLNENDYETSSEEEEMTEHRMHKIVLDEQGILSKDEWKVWLMKNHPDRNPNTDLELVQKVTTAGKYFFS